MPPRDFPVNANPPKKPPVPSTIEHKIARSRSSRANELREKRGREGGHELEAWFCAKEEIIIKKF